ncbi:AMP-binding protein [Blastomonas sp. AAP53]|uniref:AMP-binding protein n=1 Tax=Blastomonas sp. AAP53 TaxID=1248760 RepID=UPI000374CB93|nr:AMP-binding protein [Blastomonas sp. AAP53]
MIAVHARLQPDRLAAHDLTSGETWTYRQLDRLVGGLVAALRQRGIAPGDRIALHARNSVAQVALHFACARLGAIFVPLNWRLGEAELAQLLTLANPSLVMGDPQAPATIAGLSVRDFPAFVTAASKLEPARDQVPDWTAPSLILFTSGTSGASKGVALSERALRETAVNFGVLTRVDSTSTVLCEAPMFHIIGLVTNIRPVLTQGGTILVSDGFQPERTLGRLQDADLGITHFIGVPQMMEMIRRQPGFDPDRLRHLVALVSGGAPHDHEDQQSWLGCGIPMVLGYGMSEAGTIFGMPADCGIIAGKIGSVGLRMPGVETRICGADGAVCRPGEAGELKLRGPNLFCGYWHNPQETAAVVDGEGWFATGDIVREDDDGFYWIVDRKKDMFISGGENVYPAEIETQLRSYPGLAACALVGVPDAQWGEVGHLVLVPQPGATISAADVQAFLSARLARYKLPRHISLRDALPVTATGKVQKGELRRALVAADAGA